MLFGGLTSLTNSEVSNETWTWDGKTWTQLHPVNSPSARYGAGVAYDPVNQVLVLYGGNSNGRWATDTWTWNGTNWRQMSPQESPPGWVYSPMTYDATRKAVVLYVGAGLWPSNPVNQTWSWDGANWAQVPTSTDPNGFAINPGTIAYDAATSQTIFVGPTGTWVLDPDGWRRLTGGGAQITTNTRGLNAFAITDDVGRGVLVEVGPTGDTWTWNGSAWTAQNPALVPPERAGAALVYDQAVQRVLFFGGAIPSPGQGFTLSNDTWVWDGATWKQVAS